MDYAGHHEMIDIKLIVWDLDETFWKGTLSEEGIEPTNENIELVKTLSERGIINSISSKNNFDEAKAKLIELGVWDYFVFPKIGWYSKGNAVKETIESMGLRPVNVLFIDDNHLNLKEVSTVVPKINVLDVKDLPNVSLKYNLKGKFDKDLIRLEQYRVIESKVQARDSYDTDLDFLTSCNIAVRVKNAGVDDIDRVHELIVRTNQLNFTKIRLEYEEAYELLDDNKMNSFIVYVNDDFGDYGAIGFVSIDYTLNRVNHFCFSCRTINLGIEQYIYDYFGYPEIDLIGDTAVILKNNYKPEWVSIKEDFFIKEIEQERELPKILFKGGCDLSQMTFYLKGDIKEETNFVTKDNLSVHSEHSLILLEKSKFNADFPFLPIEAFESVFFKEKFDYIIYSVLMDYSQDLFVNKLGDIIPFMGYSRKKDTTNLSKLHKNQVDGFYGQYENKGPISPVDFRNNLKIILAKLNPSTRLIIVNGAEAEPYDNYEPGCVERHREMNLILDDFCANNSRVFLIDVRKYVKSPSDLRDNIRHYKRHIYRSIAEEISSVLNVGKRKGGGVYLFLKYYKVKGRIKRVFGFFRKFFS